MAAIRVILISFFLSAKKIQGKPLSPFPLVINWQTLNISAYTGTSTLQGLLEMSAHVKGGKSYHVCMYVDKRSGDPNWREWNFILSNFTDLVFS